MREDWFAVEDLDTERLLSEWRWLCPQKMVLVARSAFGDLFLRNEAGRIFWLQVSVGCLTQIADSEPDFRKTANAGHNQDPWFAERDAQAAADQGFRPGKLQCIGFKTPLCLGRAIATTCTWQISTNMSVFLAI
jgi:hypothetical protein